MKLEIGPEAKRQIIIKLRSELKTAIVKHEIQNDETTHMILLGDLIRFVETRKNLDEGFEL
tara:strand:+ start:3269 stop:3451 length:183 start_codon:yes stop_codon:yes gene_type:complete